MLAIYACDCTAKDMYAIPQTMYQLSLAERVLIRCNVVSCCNLHALLHKTTGIICPPTCIV